jgi:uncharacterized membrane protein
MIRRLLAEGFPPLRRHLTWSSLWPLILVLGCLGGALVFLLGSARLRLTSPWELCWLLVTPWVWYLQVAGWGGLGRLRGQLSLIVRLAVICLVVLALSGPRAVRVSDQLTVLYVLDCSDSIGEHVIDQKTAWISETAGAKPPHDAAGLIVFGHDAAVEIPPRQAFTYDAISSRLVRDGTNLENALALAAATLPAEAPGRIVLISDGTATEGDTERMVDQLAARAIPVDVLPVSYEHAEEVWLERLELPQEVHARQSYEAGIVLGSLAPGHGSLVLTENGHEVARQQVDYPAGKSRYTVPLYLREAGYYEYAATIEPQAGHDTWHQNNTVLGAISLRGSGHVLLVTDTAAPEHDWRPLERALHESGRSVEVKTASELPEDPLALESCDAIALVDVPADAVSENQQLALRDAVQDQGIGLVMIGGPNSFGPGGWNHSTVEEALPVTMDVTQRKVLPKGALAIIIEMCEFPDGDGWAKLITKKAMQVLSARDDVGVITYSYNGDGDHWIFPLSSAKDYERLAPLVDGADLGDMPSFDSILRVALTGLQADDAAAKHVLLISDGDCAPPSPELLKEFAQAGIPISTVLIVPDSDDAKVLMRQIAKVTQGRYYYPASPQALPAVFIKEAKTIKRSEIQNIDFTPRITFPSPVLKGLGQLPPLKGYTLTTAKPHALTVLAGPDKEEDDPVLATWRFGVGTAAAWTSDLNGNWGARWLTWERYRAFVDQLFTNLARAQETSTIGLTLDASSGSGSLVVEDHAQTIDFLTVSARILSPTGVASTIDVPQVAPGRYATTFALNGIGRYHVGVSAIGGQDGKRQDHAVGSLNMSYSAEYLRFRANPLVLSSIANRTGGRVLTGHEDGATLFPLDRASRQHSTSIADLVLAAVALLVPVDVAIRRVSFDPLQMLSRLAFWRRRRSSSSATMGALLGRKATIGMPRAEGPLQPLQPLPPPLARATAPPAATPVQPASKPASPPVPGNTTGKLLEARRRRQQNPQEPP